MWIKFCGATRLEDAVAVASSGADALGLNFFPGSRRFVSEAHAADLADAARAAVTLLNPPTPPQPPCLIVGVFVNAPPDDVHRIAHTVRLDAVQLHGDEDLETIQEIRRLLPQTLLIRALRASGDRLPRLLDDIESLQQAALTDAFLLDAFVPGSFGGTGARIDASVVAACQQKTTLPLILAGGLDPQNIAAAIQTCRPFGVDTAGGIETQPGHKDPEKMLSFVAAARSAAQTSQRSLLKLSTHH